MKRSERDAKFRGGDRADGIAVGHWQILRDLRAATRRRTFLPTRTAPSVGSSGARRSDRKTKLTLASGRYAIRPPASRRGIRRSLLRSADCANHPPSVRSFRRRSLFICSNEPLQAIHVHLVLVSTGRNLVLHQIVAVDEMNRSSI